MRLYEKTEYEFTVSEILRAMMDCRSKMPIEEEDEEETHKGGSITFSIKVTSDKASVTGYDTTGIKRSILNVFNTFKNRLNLKKTQVDIIVKFYKEFKKALTGGTPIKTPKEYGGFWVSPDEQKKLINTIDSGKPDFYTDFSQSYKLFLSGLSHDELIWLGGTYAKLYKQEAVVVDDNNTGKSYYVDMDGNASEIK